MKNKKPSAEDFRAMVTAFFALRSERAPKRQNAAYDAFRRGKLIGERRSEIAALPVEPAERAIFIERLESKITALAEQWAYQQVMRAVYRGGGAQ